MSRCYVTSEWVKYGRMVTEYKPRSSANSLTYSLMSLSTLFRILLKSCWWMRRTHSWALGGRAGLMHWLRRLVRRIFSVMNGEGYSLRRDYTLRSQWLMSLHSVLSANVWRDLFKNLFKFSVTPWNLFAFSMFLSNYCYLHL